jgi:hypothetical protein
LRYKRKIRESRYELIERLAAVVILQLIAHQWGIGSGLRRLLRFHLRMGMRLWKREHV